MENTTVDPWGVSKENKKPRFSLCDLYGDQEDSTTSQTESKTAMVPSHRLLAAGTTGGPATAVGRHGI